jgi:hypothetical protein
MKKIIIHIYPFIIAILFIITPSCREDVITPDNLVTNVNEPIQISEQNSYTFVMNADNISMNVINNTSFSSHISRISISISDYSSGYIRINVLDIQSNDRFSYFGDDDEVYFTEELFGYVPRSIKINTVNFSGKFKIQLTRTF